MKKLLATLLVAVMVMSCMTFVAFAESAEVYTQASYPFMELVGADEDAWELYPEGKAYYNYLGTLTGLKKPTDKKATPIYLQTWTSNEYLGERAAEPGVMPATATTADIVVCPVYANGDGVNAYTATYKYDPAFLTPYVDSSDSAFGAQNLIKDGELVVGWTSASGNGVKGLLGCVYFNINDDAIGDANGLATTIITVDVDTSATATADTTKATVGENTMEVKLSGLTAGAAEEAPKMEAADVAAMEASKIVYAGEDTFANFKNAYGLNEDVAADYTEEMSYVCAFGTVDTTKEADEYGFKLTTSYGKVITGKAVNVVDGKFGIVFYGADYLIEGATIEAYAIVDGAEI